MKGMVIRFVSLSLFLLFGMFTIAFLVRNAGTSFVERTVGVKVGDWVKYGDFQVLWGSDDPQEEPWPGLVEVNQTEWVRNEVVAISESKITFESVTKYENGTSITIVSSVHVETGIGPGNLTFISADLAPGDSVYNSSYFLDNRINETIPGTYAGLTRPTNHLNTSLADPFEGTVMVSNQYWDKATGIRVERRISFLYKTGDYITWATLWDRMIDNNIWIGVPDATPPIADAGDDQIAEAGVSVAFDAGDSVDDVGIARFEWSFGDGETGTGLQTTHIYDKAGGYNVVLTVVDSKGNYDTDSLHVTVLEASPPFQVHPAIAAFTVFALIFLLYWFLFRRKSRSSRSRSRTRVKRFMDLAHLRICRGL